jgi:hypothetical protein
MAKRLRFEGIRLAPADEDLMTILEGIKRLTSQELSTIFPGLASDAQEIPMEAKIEAQVRLLRRDSPAELQIIRKKMKSAAVAGLRSRGSERGGRV